MDVPHPLWVIRHRLSRRDDAFVRDTGALGGAGCAFHVDVTFRVKIVSLIVRLWARVYRRRRGGTKDRNWHVDSAEQCGLCGGCVVSVGQKVADRSSGVALSKSSAAVLPGRSLLPLAGLTRRGGWATRRFARHRLISLSHCQRSASLCWPFLQAAQLSWQTLRKHHNILSDNQSTSPLRCSSRLPLFLVLRIPGRSSPTSLRIQKWLC